MARAIVFPIGKAIRLLRETIGWDTYRWAKELQISQSMAARIENGSSYPGINLLDRIREIWGIDPYVMAYIFYEDWDKFPEPLRLAFQNLGEEFKKYIASIAVAKHRLPKKVW